MSALLYVVAWCLVVVGCLWLLLGGLYLQVQRVKQRRRVIASIGPAVAQLDEKVLLGPVSAWVAEGEARAVEEWTAERSTGKQPIILAAKPPPPKCAGAASRPSLPAKPDCDDCEWEELRVLEQAEPIAYTRVMPCTKHRLEPPADISGIKMTEIR